MNKIFYVFLLVFITICALFILKDKGYKIESPLPQIFGQSEKNEIKIINNWFPNTKTSKNTDKLNLTAKSAILVDYETGNVIYAKDPTTKLPAASTIKIMTALVALENAKLIDQFVVSEKASKIGENSMGLTIGEKLTAEELLYGLMLVSGNDAAITLAEGITGSEDQFVDLMNQKVESLGLKDTKFINATGLDEDGKEQYSNAYDLAVVAHYVWENYPKFREITSTYQKEILSSGDHKYLDFYNDTNLLTTYPGVLGIKPGFTWEAGLCLVTYAENGGKKLLAVILGSDDRRGEMKELLDLGFGTYGIKIDHPALDM